MPATENNSVSRRRYDLDWLRVLAFGLLILYHVGMYYVADWGWHIKSPEPSTVLQNVMILVNPWRMSLLFFVSGAALCFACGKFSATELVLLRSRRLLLPLLFGMAVIVPPQLYVELLTQADMPRGYLSFYRLYLDTGTEAYPDYQHSPLGLWTWNHLWFLAYLWVYTGLFVLVKPLLDRAALGLGSVTLSPLPVLVLPVVMLLLYRLWLAESFPPNNALFGDWYNHARYFSMMILGYVVARSDGFWRVVEDVRRTWLGLALLSYGACLLVFHGWFEELSWFDNEWLVTTATRLLVSFDQWLWILAALGYGKHYLDRSGPVLRYMNTAILPWYMLHQTLIVLLAFGLAPLALPQALEVLLLIAGTVAGCALGYEIVRRFYLGRLLFGLKTGTPAGRSDEAGNPVAAR